MVILQPDMSFQRPALWVRKVAYGLPVQFHFNIRPNGFNFKWVPLAEGVRRKHRRCSKLIDGPGHMKRTSRCICVWVISSIVDLDFVTVVYGHATFSLGFVDCCELAPERIGRNATTAAVSRYNSLHLARLARAYLLILPVGAPAAVALYS